MIGVLFEAWQAVPQMSLISSYCWGAEGYPGNRFTYILSRLLRTTPQQLDDVLKECTNNKYVSFKLFLKEQICLTFFT